MGLHLEGLCVRDLCLGAAENRFAQVLWQTARLGEPGYSPYAIR